MSKAVGYMLGFMIWFVILNSTIYGIIIHSNWDELGKLVDNCSRFDIMFPMLLVTVVTSFGLIAVHILDGDW